MVLLDAMVAIARLTMFTSGQHPAEGRWGACRFTQTVPGGHPLRANARLRDGRAKNACAAYAVRRGEKEASTT